MKQTEAEKETDKNTCKKKKIREAEKETDGKTVKMRDNHRFKKRDRQRDRHKE